MDALVASFHEPKEGVPQLSYKEMAAPGAGRQFGVNLRRNFTIYWRWQVLLGFTV